MPRPYHNECVGSYLPRENFEQPGKARMWADIARRGVRRVNENQAIFFLVKKGSPNFEGIGLYDPGAAGEVLKLSGSCKNSSYASEGLISTPSL